jgi:RNA polymerase-binding protein DksA
VETSNRRTPFSDDELAEFRDLILDKRRRAMEDVELMREQLRDGQESGGDSAYSLHMADAGTDASDRERLFEMISRQQVFVGHLDRALERIENKTYGVCRATGKPIDKGRLLAVPHTEISIEAKRKEQRK